MFCILWLVVALAALCMAVIRAERAEEQVQRLELMLIATETVAVDMSVRLAKKRK